MLTLLEFIFINLALTTVITGYLINNFEEYIPAFIIKGFRYGAFAYQGPEAGFLKTIEIPKSWYRHFYIFSVGLCSVFWILMVSAYFLGFQMNHSVGDVLSYLVKCERPTVSKESAFIALTLLTVQSYKRLYETTQLQVFARNSKMNISHYAAGLVHYLGCAVAVVGDANLFCGKEIQPKQLNYSLISTVPIAIFLWACYEQLQTNIIFANLRKDKKSGKLVTEDHRIPYGRLFGYISSPHRLCELVMYTVLIYLVPTRLFATIYFWVLSNQIQTAIQAHEWYKKTFKSYPQNRTAIFPRLL